ncbi:BatA domain-containing protein [Kiritimatiellota bacterium B12222]|nr:BatA domain-containing protein [Kiritimatiellota bacterium B12222]
MGISFLNPLAFWGLLALPVIVAIHFLQSRNRREEISTLFLLELLPEETRSGAVFSYLRNGLQLWMQLLAVLLLSFMLAGPLWLREESVQSIAVVVDSSLSMQAFTEELYTQVDALSAELDGSAGRSEWWVLPSDATRRGLLSAGDREGLLEALAQLKPVSGPHSPRPALLRARQLVGKEGVVLYISDHVMAQSGSDVVAISVGEPIVNTGFTGMKVEGDLWTASVIHFGPEAIQRRVEISMNGQVVDTLELTLKPGVLDQVSGELPADFERGMLILEADDYAPDNVLPFVRPQAKPLAYRIELPDAEQVWVEKLMQTLAEVHADTSATLWWGAGWPRTETPEHAAEIWFLEGEEQGDYQVPVADGVLTQELNWEGFLALPYKGFHLRSGDQVLLWMGEMPLVILRESEQGNQLLLNFDMASSNASRFPSFLLLLHRWIQAQQQAQAFMVQTNIEARQVLDLGVENVELVTMRYESVTGVVTEKPVDNPAQWQAPDEAGYVSVMAGERPLLKAAVFVGDVSEGNFRQARSSSLPDDLVLMQRKQNSESDFLMPLWFMLLGLLVTLSWWSGKGSRDL